MNLIASIIFLFSLTAYSSDCLFTNTENPFVDHEKASCKECKCKLASFPEHVKDDSNFAYQLIQSKVGELIDTKMEILISNLSRFDSFMEIEGFPLPPSKTCNIETLNKLLNCPNVDIQLKEKGLKSKAEFLAKISKKFSNQQNVSNKEQSCISNDALNYIIAKKSPFLENVKETLKESNAILDSESLQVFRKSNYRHLSNNPVLLAAFSSYEAYKYYQASLKQNKESLPTTLSNLSNDKAFFKHATKALENDCSATFKEIVDVICKNVSLPTKDLEEFVYLYDKKEIPNIFFKEQDKNKKQDEKEALLKKLQNAECQSPSKNDNLSILALVNDFSNYFPRKPDINVKNLNNNREQNEKAEEISICRLKDFDCGKDQCSANTPEEKNCKPRKSTINFTEMFNLACTEPGNICAKDDTICSEHSSIYQLKQYEFKSKAFISTIATTTTKKDEVTGKETTTTTYETVRRVSSFAKSFHGDSKPAGTTLSIPPEKENVTVQVKNAAGQDITREVAPEVEARQAERPQQIQPQQAIRTEPVANTPNEYRTETRKDTSPTIEPIEPTNKIADSEMASYRDLINDIQKTKRELKETSNAEEKKRLQDRITDLEEQKRKSAFATPIAAPKSIDPAVAPAAAPTNTTPTRSSAKNYANTAGEQPDSPNEDATTPENNTPAQNARPAAPATPAKAAAAAKSNTGTKKAKDTTGEGAANTIAGNATGDANASLNLFKEFPIQSQESINLSTILEKDIEILNEGKAFAIYETIKDESGKNIKISLEFEPIIKIDPITNTRTIKFRPRLTGNNKSLYEKMRKHKGNNELLVSVKLSDGMKFN